MLITQLKTDMMQARKSRESDKVTMLSALIGECERGEKDPDDNKVRSTIKKNIATLQDNLATVGDRPVSADIASEIALLSQYIPTQMSEAELRTEIGTIISSGANNIGAIMKGLQSQFSGKYDGKLAQTIIKEELGK